MAPILNQSVPLIGRADDLAAIDQLLIAAIQGQRQLVLLSGEAGIGKSHLAAEIRDRARSRSFTALVGQCFPSDRTTPYAPILDLLRTRYTRKDTQPITSRETDTLQILCQLLPEIAPLSPKPVMPLSLEPEAHKQQLMTALLTLFANLMTHAPLLLIFEDLHWSDESSLDFLMYLARWSGSQPLFLLLTYRTDEYNTTLERWLARIDREHTFELRLTPLPLTDVSTMMQHILGQSAPFDMQDAVYTLTEGNPLFVEEILKALIASGGIILLDGVWQYVSRQAGLHVPRSIQEMIRQRVVLLSRGSQQVLKIASVIGRRFDFSLLQMLTGLDEAALLAVIKELIAAQFVVQESGESFSFRHILMREAVYQELLVRERQHLHQTVAETVERLSAETRTPHLTELAYHFYEAAIWNKALTYTEHAAEEAQALHAPYAAIEQWTHVLDAGVHLDIPPSSHTYLSRGHAYEITGAFELARADYEHALTLARPAHDTDAEWQSLIALGFLWTGRDYTQAGSFYQQAIELAQHTGDPLLLARSLNYLGNWQMNIEHPHEAMNAHQQALAIFQQADYEAGLAATYDLLGMTAMLGGDALQSTACYQRAIAYFEKRHDHQGLVSSLATLMVLGEGGGSEMTTMVLADTPYATSLGYGERALQIAHEISHRSAEAYALIALSQYLGPHGEYSRAFDTAHTCLTIAEQIGHHQWLTAAYWQLGVLYLDVLELSQAQLHFEEALALAQMIGSLNWIRTVSAFFAQLMLLQGDINKAETLLNGALPLDDPMQTVGQRLVWDARASLAFAQNKPDLALNIVDCLISSASNLSTERVIPHLWKTRGEALIALGQKSEGETVLQAAYTSAKSQELCPLHWRIALTLGKLYRSQGRRKDADHMFAAARTTIEALAAPLSSDSLRQSFLTATERMLPHRRPLTSRRAEKATFEGLTARERDIAALIGQGYTNRAIAEQLVLSERTVEGHVTAILTKLGGTTRTQIATWAVEKDLIKRSL